MKYVATIEGTEYLVEIIDDSHVRVGDQLYTVDFAQVSGQPIFSLLVDGRSIEAYVTPEDGIWEVLLHGTRYPVTVEDEREKRLRAASGGNIALSGDTPIKAPMPGLVIGVQVSDGQTVAKGDILLILESMKMQNELRSPRDGVVSRLKISSGQSVERNQIMLYVGSGT